MRLDSFARDRAWREGDRIKEAISSLDGTLDADPYPYPGSREASETRHRNSLFRSAEGARYLIRLLTGIRRDIDRSLSIDGNTSCTIRKIFEHRAEELCRVLAIRADGADAPDEAGGEREGDRVPERPPQTMDPAEWRRSMLRLLQQELQRLKADLTSLEEHEELEGEARRAIFAIPDEKMGEQLSRAERGLENQRYRALQELERLQQQRRDREP